MKNKKNHRLFGMLALVFSGAVFFSGRFEIVLSAKAADAFKERFTKGVKIDGILVGGMRREEGLKLLRKSVASLEPRLEILSPNGAYLFGSPEIDFTDDFEELFFSADKKGAYESKVCWRLNGLEEKIERIVDDNARARREATLSFSSAGFTYYPEQTGIVCDRERLRTDILSALAASPVLKSDGYRFSTVRLYSTKEEPHLTTATLKKRTEKLSSFTTCFSETDGGRCENIRRAAELLDGLSVFPDQIFSFNASVGKRTRTRGFKEAKIIEGGKFVSGVGGGVCQVSSTLYNAALLSGMTVVARSAHSLAVSYVPPSRDAMVSSESDFKFKNPYDFPVYLSVKTGKGFITATFYGKSDGCSYKIVEKIVGEIEPPEPEIRYGETEGEIKSGRKGIRSEAYLERYANGALLSRKKLSEDAYAPTRGIIGKKNDNRTKKTP